MGALKFQSGVTCGTTQDNNYLKNCELVYINNIAIKPTQGVTSKRKLLSAICAVLLSACDEGMDIPSGGSAGDTGPNSRVQESISLLQPFVGVYDLQDNWMGQSGDEAFLVIRLTGNDGISEAALDDILQFTEAELSLSGDTLTIEAVDLFDVDDDLNTSETVAIRALKLGVTENDLGNSC